MLDQWTPFALLLLRAPPPPPPTPHPPPPGKRVRLERGRPTWAGSGLRTHIRCRLIVPDDYRPAYVFTRCLALGSARIPRGGSPGLTGVVIPRRWVDHPRNAASMDWPTAATFGGGRSGASRRLRKYSARRSQPSINPIILAGLKPLVER